MTPPRPAREVYLPLVEENPPDPLDALLSAAIKQAKTDRLRCWLVRLQDRGERYDSSNRAEEINR